MYALSTSRRTAKVVAVALACAGALAATSPSAFASASAAAAGVPIELEAEHATPFGGAGVNDNHLGYSGTGFVDGFVIDHQGTAGVTFTVDVPAAGEYGLNLRYANGLGSTMTLSQVVGGEDRQIELPSAVGASWSQWFVHQEVVALAAGEQEVTFRFDADDTGNVNLDAIALTTVGDLTTPGGGPTPPGGGEAAGPDTRWDDVVELLVTSTGRSNSKGGEAYEAEGAFFANGAVASDGGVDLGAGRARLVVPVNASADGRQRVTLRYANRTGERQEVVLGVDGDARGRLVLPPTDGWSTLAVRLDLRGGLGSVELRRPGTHDAAGLVVDHVALRHGEPMAERGATVPYIAYEAEHGTTDGELLTPSRTFRQLAAEASGRQAVVLDAEGESVAWRLDEPASALVLRASIPDSADGRGLRGSLGVYAGGERIAEVGVSSAYSWVYGGYPYGNDPSQGGAQRFFDDSRVVLPRELPAGTVLRLVRDAQSADVPYTVDLVETEVVPDARTAPAGFVDVTDHGATAGDGTDDTAAFVAAVATAREAGTGVWVPEGRFTLTQRLRVHDVTVRGAGPWYSVLEGRDGKGGIYAQGTGVTIADLMVDGDVRYRDDARFDAALEGSFGQGSLVQNVWVEHTKVGLWVDAGTNGLYALGLRVRDTFADGVHLHGMVTDTRVEHSSVRNTGDDAMAMWSSGGPVTRGVFAHDTVEVPLLGNGLAIYGGDSNRVADNVVRDTLTAAAGIAVSTRFNPVPFSGTTVAERNTLVRTGGWEPNWNTSFGAIWVFADTSHITTPVVLRGNDLIDSTYEGILASGSHWVNDLRVSDTVIENTGSYGLAFRLGGDHRLRDVTVSGVPVQGDGNRFHFWGTVIDEGGNRGIFGDLPQACTVTYAPRPAPAGRFAARVTIGRADGGSLAGATLAWHVGSGAAVQTVRGGSFAQDGDRVAVSGLGGSHGGTVLDIDGTANGPVTAPEEFTLDGVPCLVEG